MAPYIDLDNKNQLILTNVVKKADFKALDKIFEKQIKILEDNLLVLVQLKLNTYEQTEEQLRQIERQLEEEKKKSDDDLNKQKEKEAEENKRREDEEKKKNLESMIK